MTDSNKQVSYLSDVYAPDLDWKQYVASKLPKNWNTLTPEIQSTVRIAATKNDPLLFALLYFRKTLHNEAGDITFADMHIEFCQILRRLRNKEQIKYAFIAPRRYGKTTWMLKILMMWLVCHNHIKFPLYITASTSQAKKWMSNIKRILDANKLIKADYRDMCYPARRSTTNRAFNDDSHLYSSDSGITIAAFGMQQIELGLNIDDARADLIIFDDIEPHGGTYSLYQVEQRLTSLVQGAIPMGGENASIIFAGTVNIASSIMDQLRTHITNPEPKSWVTELGITVRHYFPIIENPDGTRRSGWEGVHKLEYLLSIEGTRYYRVVYANDPLPINGSYWREGDISYGSIDENEPQVTVLSMDHAVTKKAKSDFTAFSVIRYAPRIDKAEVIYARAFKLNPGTEGPQKVLEILGNYPEIVVLILETNQGGDLLTNPYKDIPVQIWEVHQKVPKVIRAARVLHLYQTKLVTHSHPLPDLEKQMYAFPNALNDDLVDCVSTAVLELRSRYDVSVKHVEDSESTYV